MKLAFAGFGFLGGICIWAFCNNCVHGQVTPDNTLNTSVSGSSNYTITNGTRVGNNLFHSFSQFSIPNGGYATFDNDITVENIFSRVSGSHISTIDGQISTKGNANLFLINPSGIIFGPNASLSIAGSFVATTANSVKFADGTEFSAINLNQSPLLIMSVPIGLQMGQNSGSITVQGIGNKLTDSTGFGTANASTSPIGLQAGINQTLALIASGVNFSGGVTSTNESGHLEVGSVSRGTVGLNATSRGWVGDYSAVSQYNDIHLAQESLLNATGSNGSILLQGQNISLTEGSAGLLQNLGTQSSGGITVNARGSLNLTGNTSNGQLGSLLQINNFSTGQVGDITISAAQLSLQDGARIVTRTRTTADGSNVITNVRGKTEVSGFNHDNPAIYTAIITFSLAQGNAGNITVSTDNLQILDSGEIISVAVNSGQTGTIQVNATDQVKIAGYNPKAFSESSLSTFTQGSGNANRAVINTARLVIQGGASLGSSSAASGSAGSVEVNASESINIEGSVTQGMTIGLPSRIFSNVEIPDLVTQAVFQLPSLPTGNSGSLKINTPLLRLTDGGAVSVKNDGTGQAGDLQVQAKSIFLDNQGSITASTTSGNGGDIRLNLQDYLLMRHDSVISATAKGQGNGGNLSINSPVIVGLENSDIIANAVQGRGGNIQIATQGIIGLEFRNTLTPRVDLTNDITASSQFNIDGTVEINNIGVDPNSGLVQLPVNITDPAQQIARGCNANTGSSFVAIGRGGVPQNPMQQVWSDRTWSDIRDISAFHKIQSAQAQMKKSPETLVQATGVHRRLDGTIELIANKSSIPVQTQLTCKAVPQE
ncbi:S-layer family protein [Nostoc sp. FACHB-110]|uniref:two-partner secretion domain-containing protein n=1 Tax=Nostoc sp. FACHB-110 TaxID=2692834 RepID=UPI0016880256|nr:S-layer family protein [Nostoc sp. FACHB-110]MBD2435500.1 S-layer family protein [Nostoc sp. FACHB-110]